MKKFIVCITVFLIMLWFSGNFVHAKTPNRLQVISAVAYMTDTENMTDTGKLIIEIYALNFGDDPQVKLGDNLLLIESILDLDQKIIAYLPGGIESGTYRLSVARSGFHFSHPEKADSLDVTISDTESGESGESSGALERGNIYERSYTHTVTGPADAGTITATCYCDDENDIALNGGFRILTFNIDPELTIMESEIYFEENGQDSYQVLVKNHSALEGRQAIQVEANVRCIPIP
jgi:hypothetical protein